MRITLIIWMSLILITLNQSLSYAKGSIYDAQTLHILYYENIEYEEDPYQFLDGLPLEDFKKHLNFFKNSAFSVIDLEKINHDLNKKEVINVAIVLNGNDEEALTYALPLLEKYKFPVHIVVNPSDTAYRKPKNSIFDAPYLNVKFPDNISDFSQKILNDATGRFRHVFEISPSTLFLNNSEIYYRYQPIFGLYNFNTIFLPTHEANQMSANDPIKSYITVKPSFGNIDIMRTYLNRRPLPYKNLTATKHEDHNNNHAQISWGLSLPEDIEGDMRCLSSEGTKADVHTIDNRVEIRYHKHISTNAIKMHCTIGILDKNHNKTDTYRYMMLHEPIL